MFLSERISAVDQELSILSKKATPEEQAFYKQLRNIVAATAEEVDLLSSRVEELMERMENDDTYMQHLSATLQSLQECIVGDVTVDADAYTAEYDAEKHCDCGHHDSEPNSPEDSIYYDEPEERYVTLQCSFCEELFFIEEKELSETVECPFCGKQVSVQQCRLDQD